MRILWREGRWCALVKLSSSEYGDGDTLLVVLNTNYVANQLLPVHKLNGQRPIHILILVWDNEKGISISISKIRLYLTRTQCTPYKSQCSHNCLCIIYIVEIRRRDSEKQWKMSQRSFTQTYPFSLLLSILYHLFSPSINFFRPLALYLPLSPSPSTSLPISLPLPSHLLSPTT